MNSIASVLFLAGCVALATGASLPAELIAKFTEAVGDCKATGVTKEEIKDIMQHKIPETRNAQCFMACMKKKLGIMNEDNSINLENAKKMFEPIKAIDADLYDKMSEIAETCTKEIEVDADECLMAKKMAECCDKYTKKHGIKPLEFPSIAQS